MGNSGGRGHWWWWWGGGLNTCVKSHTCLSRFSKHTLIKICTYQSGVALLIGYGAVGLWLNPQLGHLSRINLESIILGLRIQNLVGSIYRSNSCIHATRRARWVGVVLITHAFHQCSFQQQYVKLISLVPYPFLVGFLRALWFLPTLKISLVIINFYPGY